MDPSLILDIIKNEQKLHLFFALLPLISFIIFGINKTLIIGYTIIYSFFVVYNFVLLSFKKQATNTLLKPPKADKEDYLYEIKTIKEKLKLQLSFAKQHLWYIPYIPFFLVVIIIISLSFFYSFYLSIINKNNNYAFIIFLAHIFLSSYMLFLYIVLKYYRKLLPKIKNETN